MRKVPPILKPIALLTISTIIATATGVVNSGSYRQPSRATETTETTETTEQAPSESTPSSMTEDIQNQTPASRDSQPTNDDQQTTP